MKDGIIFVAGIYGVGKSTLNKVKRCNVKRLQSN